MSGSFIGGPSDADDAHELLRHGAARWQLIAFGVIAAAIGIRLWHGLGPSFGMGASQGKADRKRAAPAVIALFGWLMIYLIVAAVSR